MLLMTAYERSGQPVCEAHLSQDIVPFLIRALNEQSAFDSGSDEGVSYRNQNLYLAGVGLGLEAHEHHKVAEDLARLVPPSPPLLA